MSPAASKAAAAARTTTKTVSSKFFASKASKRVGRWFEDHPVVSNSVLCLNLWIVGDCLAQYSEDRWLLPPDDVNATAIDTTATDTDSPDAATTAASSSTGFWSDRFDAGRTARCAGFGAVVSGPVLALWYPFLEKVCHRARKTALMAAGGSWAAPVAKVAADELLMEPPMLALFFGGTTALEGGTAGDCRDAVRTQFWPSWTASLAVWPVVLLGTFRFLPVPAQAPAINAGCVLWDGFLSHRKALAAREQRRRLQPADVDAAPTAAPSGPVPP